MVEMGSPKDLLRNPDSQFSSMVEATGKENAAYLRRVAEGHETLSLEKEVSSESIISTGAGAGGRVMLRRASSFRSTIDPSHTRFLNTEAGKACKDFLGKQGRALANVNTKPLLF